MANGIGFQGGFQNPPNFGFGGFGQQQQQQPFSFGNVAQQGLFGLGDLATGGLLGVGGNLLSGLGGLLGGKSDEEKRAGEVFNLAQNRLGQDVFDPSQFTAEFQRANQERQNQAGEAIDQRLGLDSGVAQGELQNMIQGDLARFMLQGQLQNAQMVSRNDNMLLQLMGSLGR